MKKALHHFEALEGLVRRARSSDEQVLQRLYDTLLRRFLPLALRFLKDPHEAQAAFDDAFMKLQTKLAEGFTYQGEGRFYSYFKKILQNACRDQYRKDKPRRDWESEHLMPSAPADEDGEDVLEYIERAIGYDPALEEAEARRGSQFCVELASYTETEITVQDQRFCEAYRALTETPGSHEWSYHEQTAFLKSYLSLPESTFYPAHTRFKQRLEPFACRWQLVRDPKKPSSR